MKVLVPTDGSESSMKAVRMALDMAKHEGAKITLMSVAFHATRDFDEMPPNIQDKLDVAARNALNKAKAVFEAEGIPVESDLEAGYVPANNIVEKAREGKYDKVVMGSTGTSALKEVLIGSTAAKVSAHAPCTVIIAR